MEEFKFDVEDVDDQTIRIIRKLAPLLADEHPLHVLSMATMMLASYLTRMSVEAEVSLVEVDDMIDAITAKIRHAVRHQRVHYRQFENPGNA